MDYVYLGEILFLHSCLRMNHQSVNYLVINTNTIPFIYREARSSALEESLEKLGVEKLSKDDVQKMQWEALEHKIGNWIHYMRIAVRN